MDFFVILQGRGKSYAPFSLAYISWCWLIAFLFFTLWELRKRAMFCSAFCLLKTCLSWTVFCLYCILSSDRNGPNRGNKTKFWSIPVHRCLSISLKEADFLSLNLFYGGNVKGILIPSFSAHIVRSLTFFHCMNEI